jgi:C4-dicarboxylate-specific signal transduction histidine kinase
MWSDWIAEQGESHPSLRDGCQELGQALRGFRASLQEVLEPLKHSTQHPVAIIPLIEQAWANACTALGDLWACQLRLEAQSPSTTVLAIEDRLQNVLHNLFKNAMEASPNGWVCCSVEQAERQVILQIADGANGLQEHMLLQPQTTKEGGHGLGLSDVQRSLLHLGGSLDIEMGEDGGRTLIIRLPAA